MVAPSRAVLVLASSPTTKREMSRLANRFVWMDDPVPRWLVTDYDTPTSNDTYARSLIEADVCARAERFVGNLAAPATHAVCGRRSQLSRAGSREQHCSDALGRELKAGTLVF